MSLVIGYTDPHLNFITLYDSNRKIFHWPSQKLYWPLVNGPMKCHALTEWGRETHICTGKHVIIGSHNGLSPIQRQAIIWNNATILLIGHLGTNFSEILIEIHTRKCISKCRLKNGDHFARPQCTYNRLGVVADFLDARVGLEHVGPTLQQLNDGLSWLHATDCQHLHVL